MSDRMRIFQVSRCHEPRRAMARWLVILGAALGAAAGSGAQAATPSVGDTYVYRLINGYNGEVLGQTRYRVETVDAGRVTVMATPDKASAGVERTEVHNPDGNWLRHPVDSHGQPVLYEFAEAYPAYVFPLEPGKSWSRRVAARAPDAYRHAQRSVRVDGRVMGTERVRVPAGEFDTIRIRRLVWPGDTDYDRQETEIVETDWYAPALGRPVRTERRSSWLDLNRCPEEGSCMFYGDWSIYELVEAPAARR